MVAIETLYLTALLSAFIGLIALVALSQPAATPPARTRVFLGKLIVILAVVSVSSFLLYAFGPNFAARQVYGDAAARRVL